MGENKFSGCASRAGLAFGILMLVGHEVVPLFYEQYHAERVPELPAAEYVDDISHANQWQSHQMVSTASVFVYSSSGISSGTTGL